MGEHRINTQASNDTKTSASAEHNAQEKKRAKVIGDESWPPTDQDGYHVKPGKANIIGGGPHHVPKCKSTIQPFVPTENVREFHRGEVHLSGQGIDFGTWRYELITINRLLID